MTQEEIDKVFNETVGPMLMELKELCRKSGMSLLAICEYRPPEFVRYGSVRGDASNGMRLVEVAVRAEGDIDALFSSIIQSATLYGHNSNILEKIGIPRTPAGK